MCKIILTAISLLFFQATVLFAQDKPKFDPKEFRSIEREFYTKRLGMPFSPRDTWKCVNGATIDLYSTNRPAVVFLGFSACHPCRNGLPLYAMLSNDKTYSRFDFVYMSFDDSATIMNEMKEAKVATPNNIKIVSVPVKYIDSNKMAERGYPMVYFLDKNKIVQYMNGGTKPNNDRVDSMGYWQATLDKIK